MNARKHRNMMAAYTGFKGTRTVAAVQEQIPAELFDRLTGHELGLVMSAVNAAYHNGRASTGAEVVDDCLCIDGQLIPLAAINAIDVTETVEITEREPTRHFPQTTERWTTRRYTMDWSEKF